MTEPSAAVGSGRWGAWAVAAGAAVVCGVLVAGVNLKFVAAGFGLIGFSVLALFRLRTATLLIVSLAPFTNLIGSWLHVGGGSTGGMLRDMALAAIVFLWLIRVVAERRTVPLSPARLALIGFGVLVALLALLSRDKVTALYGARNLCFYAFLLFVAADLFASDRDRMIGIRVVLAALTLLSGLAIAEVVTNGRALDRIGFSLSYAGQTGSRSEIGNSFLGRRRGTAGVGNPIDFGWLAMFGFLVALGWRPRHPGDRWLRRAAVTACAAGVVISLARSAWLGSVVGAFAMWLLAGDARALRALVAAAALGAVLLVVFPETVYVSRLLTRDVASQETIRGRAAIYEYSRRFIAAHPIGAGIGTQGSANRRPLDVERFTLDSYYLQLAGEGGLLLLAAFGATLLTLLLEVRRAGRRPGQHSGDAGLATGMLAVLAAVLLASATSASMDSRIVSILFWFLLGLTLVADADPPAQQLPA